MKYEIKFTTQFKKDLKLAKKQNRNLGKLFEVINILADGETLDPKYRDHDLSGKYKGTRECHVESEMLITKLSSIHIRQIMDSIRRLSPDKQRRL